jgi:uncharacterized protein (DUF983 family)
MATAANKNRILSILHERCPKCGQGQVFEKSAHLLKFPEMKERCSACDYRFDREPGYFLGAMYLSYGLAVIQGLITFLVCYYLFPVLSTLVTTFIIMGVIILFSYKNYKLSRIMYMHIFPW